MICWNMKLTHNIYAYAFSEHSEFFKILVGINKISQSEFNKISFQKIILIANEFPEYIVWDSKSLVFFIQLNQRTHPFQTWTCMYLVLSSSPHALTQFFLPLIYPSVFWMSNFLVKNMLKEVRKRLKQRLNPQRTAGQPVLGPKPYEKIGPRQNP